LGADATRLMKRDAVAPTEREDRGRCPDVSGGSGKKLVGGVAVTDVEGSRRPLVTNCCFSDFDLERRFASNDASGEGETSTVAAAWSGGVAGTFSLLESVELLEEFDESR